MLCVFRMDVCLLSRHAVLVIFQMDVSLLPRHAVLVMFRMDVNSSPKTRGLGQWTRMLWTFRMDTLPNGHSSECVFRTGMFRVGVVCFYDCTKIGVKDCEHGQSQHRLTTFIFVHMMNRAVFSHIRVTTYIFVHMMNRAAFSHIRVTTYIFKKI